MRHINVINNKARLFYEHENILPQLRHWPIAILSVSAVQKDITVTANIDIHLNCCRPMVHPSADYEAGFRRVSGPVHKSPRPSPLQQNDRIPSRLM